LLKGFEISIYYDPLLAKLSVWGSTRAEALRRMSVALRRTTVLGLTTNRSFLIWLIEDETFAKGQYNTRIVEERFPSVAIRERYSNILLRNARQLAIVPFLWLWQARERRRTTLRHIPSGWRYAKYKNPTDTYATIADASFTASDLENVQVEVEYEFAGKTGGDSTQYSFWCWTRMHDKKNRSEEKEVPKYKVVLHDVIVRDRKDESYGSIRCSIGELRE
jgi:acetyl/propionyl-CoA carboxylase alpha subunit